MVSSNNHENLDTYDFSIIIIIIIIDIIIIINNN